MFFKVNDKKKKNKKKNVIDFFLEDDEPFIRYKKSKKKYTSFETFFISFIFLIGGLVFGCFLCLCTNQVFGTKVDKKIMEFMSTYNNITNNYYEDVNKELLIDSAISGMLSSLDDEQSYYMDQQSTSEFNSTTDGKFIGVGITVQCVDGISKVISIFENSPAEKAGIQVGDVLIKVNGKGVQEDKCSDKVTSLIAGDVGKKVTLLVKRNEEEIELKMELGVIEIQSVFSEIKNENNKKIGYIKINNFASNTYKQFKSNIDKIEKEKIDSLIIDLRYNTGGHLSQASNILDLFFKKDTVLYQIDSKGKKVKYKAQTKDSRNYPVVLLVNHGSASASEVLTSCFKENYKNATIIGKKTYGKGTIQKPSSLSSGSSYKLTTNKWLTPNGVWIHEKGIEPDIEVDDDIETEQDEQLLRAIEELKNKES